MHSGLILIFWLAAVASIQMLPPAVLAATVAACLVAAATWARSRTLRLLRRVRVLLVAIGVLFAWFTPGEALFLDWPRIGPSREGVLLAALHAGRLIAVVCAVGLLLERLPLKRLVGGLHALSRPLAVIGVSPERLALRLLLVLRYVEETPRGTGRLGWRDWLVGEVDPPAVESVRLCRERLSALDGLLGLIVFAGLLWWSLV